VTTAPFYNDIAEGPEGGRGVWLTTADGTRIRAGLWNGSGPRGTVVLLPGRTEYVEKYGRTATVLARAGYATLTLDFRGQGMSDRVPADRMVGHVSDFAEFQDDVDTVLAFARAEGLPQPFHLMAHSMGGCIGLRALLRGLPFQTVAFSAPMWGILISAWARPVASTLSVASRYLSFDHRYAPGTGPKTYVIEAPFAGNTLTTDAEMWDYMRRQALAHPDLSLGGPSLGWLRAALAECHALSLMRSPTLPCLCGLGRQERIVDTRPILRRMQAWPGGRLKLVQGAEHEILMERPTLRDDFLSDAVALFNA
jgi:lysophospholipase